MVNLLLPEGKPLSFYLAAEEYAASLKTDDSYFWSWVVPPTVIIGRNQDLMSEVNLEYCNANGINVVRRKSGGGCVYADYGNIMLSYVTGRGTAEELFDEFLSELCRVLGDLGVAAVKSGRNDILCDGKKISGNSFRMYPERGVVHGTLLYDVDFAPMSHAITPSVKKLSAKGVRSVRNRVMNIRGILDSNRLAQSSGVMDVASLRRYLSSRFCDSELKIPDKAIDEILSIERSYTNHEHLFGVRRKTNFSNSSVVEGVGEVQVSMIIEDSVIKDIHLGGDYFLEDGVSPEYVDRELFVALDDCRFDYEAVKSRLQPLDIGRMIYNFTVAHLLAIMFEKEWRENVDTQH